MGMTINRKIAGVLLMSALMVLAGCNGGGSGGTPTMNTTDNGTTPSDSGGPSSLGNFTVGDTYEYNLSAGSFENQQVTWEVVDISSDGNVTVNFTASTARGPSSTEITAPPEQVYQQAQEEMTAAVFVGIGRLPLALTAGANLTAGATVTRPLGQEMQNSLGASNVTISVGNATTVGGVQCRQVALIPDGNRTIATQTCINPEYPFAISAQGVNPSLGQFSLELESATQG